MPKIKYDGVIEAVHYNPEGQVEWVRAYLRRGVVFSDRVILERQKLVEDLKAGKSYLVGKRVPLKGATFEVSEPLKVDGDVLVVGDARADQDHLAGVPVI